MKITILSFLVLGLVRLSDAQASCFTESIEHKLNRTLGPIERPLVQCVEREGPEGVVWNSWRCMRTLIPESQPGLRKCLFEALRKAGGSPLKTSQLRACLKDA